MEIIKIIRGYYYTFLINDNQEICIIKNNHYDQLKLNDNIKQLPITKLVSRELVLKKK